jgi:DNA topoisomerase I
MGASALTGLPGCADLGAGSEQPCQCPRSSPAASEVASATVRRGRVRRSDCSGPGIKRVRRGRGFSYFDERGRPLRDPEAIDRIRALAVPPAWTDVWICSDPRGHLQATGIDAAGRKQYLYHERWRAHRDRAKFARMLGFGAALPDFRRKLARELQRQELTERRVIACTVRLLDVGMFRVGNPEYAADESGVGLATIRKEHVSLNGESIAFDYPAKGGARRLQVVHDPVSLAIVRRLKQRRGGPAELFAYRDNGNWRPIRSDDINEFIKQQLGEEFSAKDFRTWNATVMAAVTLAARSVAPRSKTARRRAINETTKEVAELLGNTPAVARRSYIDPRVFDRYQGGHTVAKMLRGVGELEVADDRTRNRVEKAVLELLADD